MPSSESSLERLCCHIHRVTVSNPTLEDGYFAEVELVNCSGSPLEVTWNHHQMERYTFVVRDGRGKLLARTSLGDRYPLRGKPAKVILAPHESLRTHFHFLGVIPKELQQPGKYLVQAVFADEHRRVESEPVEVTLR